MCSKWKHSQISRYNYIFSLEVWISIGLLVLSPLLEVVVAFFFFSDGIERFLHISKDKKQLELESRS